MSSIYFVVDNKLPAKVAVFIRGSFPNIHNNVGPYVEVAAGERKKLDHSDSRGPLSIGYGYSGQIRVWGDVVVHGKVVGQNWRLNRVKDANGKWYVWFEIDLENFKNAPGGDITVTLTPTRETNDGLEMSISSSL